jgi:hypothetical protein
LAAKKPAAGSNRANKADIHAVVGASGSGKTTHVMQCIRRAKVERLLIWDTKGEFAREDYAKPVHSIAEVARYLKAAGEAGRCRLAFQPSGDDNKRKRDFSRLCLLAFYWKNCWLIAEELAEVTLAGWAPEGWRKVTTQGRSEGVTIYGLSQSPAWVDKFFFGNCSSIRTGRLVEPEHGKKMALTLGDGVTLDEIQRLEDGQFIHLTVSPRGISRGRLF